MLTLSHLLVLGVLLLLFTGSDRLPKAAKSIGESIRSFKKGLRGEDDIDVTDSVKRIEDDSDHKS